jgi:hypothetical protein
MWVDDLGRRLSMDFLRSGVPIAPLSRVPIVPINRSPAEMASLFKDVCLSTNGDPVNIASATNMGNLNLTAAPISMPGMGRRDRPLNIWRGSGLVVSQSDGFFAARFVQCNVLFYPQQLPSREGVIDAVSGALGSAPSNAASARKRNGTFNRSYEPEWAVALAGAPAIVTAHVWEGSPVIPGSRVQISVRTARSSRSR